MSKEKKKSTRPPIAQQLVALSGAVVVAGMLGYLSYAALSGDGSPPDVAIEVRSIERNGSNYVVRFVARNSGSRTAAAVQAEARLLRNGRLVEQARATLDYVPANSRKEGGFWFTNDPRQGELTLDVTGYQLP